MPVTVQIPDTSQTQEVTFPSLNNVNGMITAGDFVYLIGSADAIGPGWIIQARKTDVTDYTLLTFPNDDKHLVPIDLCHSAGTIYVLFRNIDVAPSETTEFQLTVGRVSTASPFTILSDFVDIADTYLPQAGALTTDDTYLYVCVWQPSDVLRFRLSDAALTVGSLGILSRPHSIRYASNKLFLTGLNTNLQWVARMSLGLTIEQSVTFSVPDGQQLEGPMGVSINDLWIGTRKIDGILRRVTQSTLAITELATGQLSKGSDVENDGTNIWELFENGRAARINPNAEISLYTVNPDQDFYRQITGDGIFVFAASGTTSI